jgi:hypothetical protein
MRRSAQAVKDRMSSGSFTQSWSFTGKKAIVEPGKGVTLRLAPRWDYMQSVVLDRATQKYVPNPDYKKGLAFVIAQEHWWEGEGGRWSHEWCPRMYDEKARCAVCIAAAEQMKSGSKEDRAYGKKLSAKQVFIFNAVVGDPRLVGQDGLVDIRPISLNGVQYNAVSDIMTGGENEKAAYGDVTNPRDGYDLVFTRPVSNGGDRWSARPLPNPSPLYGQAQAVAFKGWATRLIDLEAMLADETKDEAGIFLAFYGRDPNPGEIEGDDAPQQQRIDMQQKDPNVAAETAKLMAEDAADAAGDADVNESAADPESPDDAFMPPPPASERAQRSPATPPGPGARTAPRARVPRR